MSPLHLHSFLQRDLLLSASSVVHVIAFRLFVSALVLLIEIFRSRVSLQIVREADAHPRDSSREATARTQCNTITGRLDSGHFPFPVVAAEK
jgi:hypothetical protein